MRRLGGAVVSAFLLQPAKNGAGARHQASMSLRLGLPRPGQQSAVASKLI